MFSQHKREASIKHNGKEAMKMGVQSAAELTGPSCKEMNIPNPRILQHTK